MLYFSKLWYKLPNTFIIIIKLDSVYFYVTVGQIIWYFIALMKGTDCVTGVDSNISVCLIVVTVTLLWLICTILPRTKQSTV